MAVVDATPVHGDSQPSDSTMAVIDAISVTDGSGQPDANTSASIFDGPATILGCFDVPNSADAAAITTSVTRLIVSATQIKNAIAAVTAGTTNALVTQINDLAGAGVAIVISINWSNSGSPALADQAAQEATLTQFTELFGAKLAAIAVDNEFENLDVGRAADQTIGSDGTYPGINWMKAQAATIHSAIAATPGLARLRVSSGAFDKLLQVEQGTATSAIATYEAAAIAWVNSDSNVDLVDIHLHEVNLANLQTEVAYTQNLITKPLIATEGSQAGAINALLPHAIDATFATTYSLSPTMTYKGFIDAAYANPVALDEWQAFIDTIPFDTTYIPDGFAYLASVHLRFVDYGQWGQYGVESFDWKQLHADKTVVLLGGAPQENQPFADEFRALAASLTQ